MAQPYASNLKFGLQDLIAGGVAPAYAEPSAPGSPTDALTPEEVALYQMLTNPNADTKPRVAEKPSRLGQVLMGLGDAGNAYASIIGNAPQVRSNNLGEYMQYLKRQNASTQLSNQQLAEDASRRKLAGATFLMNRKERKQEADDTAAAKKEMLAYRTAQDKQHAIELGDARAQAKALNDADNATRIAIEDMGNKNRLAVAGAEVRIHADRAKGEGDKAQHQVYVQLKGAIVAKKREYAQMLAEGKITPEQIDAEWADIRSAVDLDPNGPYAAAADAFFKDQIDPVKMKYAPAQGPSVQPYGATGPIPQGQIDANRQVARQGAKF